MFHVADYHDNCPKNHKLWCHQQSILNGTNSYKDKGDFSLDLRSHSSCVQRFMKMCAWVYTKQK